MKHTGTRIFTQVQAIARWIPTSCMSDLELSLELRVTTGLLLLFPSLSLSFIHRDSHPPPRWGLTRVAVTLRKGTRGDGKRGAAAHAYPSLCLHSATCGLLYDLPGRWMTGLPGMPLPGVGVNGRRRILPANSPGTGPAAGAPADRGPPWY